MDLNNFPTYKRTLSSFERSYMFEPKMGWACIGWPPLDMELRKNWKAPTKEEREKFDEDFNHKAYDKAGIPRVIDQPVDFEI